MLYYLSELYTVFSPLRMFQYISFRTLGAAATAFIIALLMAPGLIRRLRAINFGELTEDGGQKTEIRGLRILESWDLGIERPPPWCHLVQVEDPGPLNSIPTKLSGSFLRLRPFTTNIFCLN